MRRALPCPRCYRWRGILLRAVARVAVVLVVVVPLVLVGVAVAAVLHFAGR